MYVGLWSRLEGFERDALTRALERRTVVQATLMRSTIHLVSRADFWPLALATRAARRASWLRAVRDAPGEAELEAAAQTLRDRLGDGTLPRKEVEALLGKPLARAVGLWLDLVRAPPSGTWERRRADLYAAAEAWLGPPEIDEAAAMEHLVRRYLAGFGPAARADVASFTGLPPGTVRGVLERLELRRFRERGRRGAARRAARAAARPGDAGAAALPARPGTRRSSSTPAAPACCPRSTGRGCSASATRTRTPPS